MKMKLFCKFCFSRAFLNLVFIIIIIICNALLGRLHTDFVLIRNVGGDVSCSRYFFDHYQNRNWLPGLQKVMWFQKAP